MALTVDNRHPIMVHRRWSASTTAHASSPRALLIGLLLASSFSAAASSPSFRKQVDAYARGRSLTVDWVSDAQLDEDPEMEHLARLCIPSEASGPGHYVLEQAPGVLWTISMDYDTRTCPSSPPEESPLPTRLKLSMNEGWSWSSASVAFRDGRPIVIESSKGRATQDGTTSGSTLETEDWDTLILSSSSTYPENTDSGNTHETSFASAILPVLASPGAAATLPPTLNQVTQGAKQHTGEMDASFRVAALAQGTNAVRLRIQVRDDVTVPATAEMSDQALLGTDHLEIWWATRNSMGSSTQQLAVARTSEGPLLARWLHPAGHTDPLPTVALDGDTFFVDLPRTRLGVSPSEDYWYVSLTVAFSDSDAPGAGQQTVVATSPLRWNASETFGRLAAFPGHTRHPTFEQSRWDLVSIRPPSRLELTAAGLPVIPEQAPPSPSIPPPEPSRWQQKAGQFLPFLLAGVLFVAIVAATSRRDASRVLLVLGGLFAALAFSAPFSLSFDKHPDALSGLIILPVFAVTNLVLLPLSVGLTWKLSRTLGSGRVWLACALATVYLLSVLAM